MKIVNVPVCESLSDAYLVAYLREDQKRMAGRARDALIVCPGGGYNSVSEREAEPISVRFAGEGFQVFELHYSVGEKAADLLPLKEVCLAVAHVRENAEAYRVDPHRIFVLGFSAGGHLAASAGTLWRHEALAPYTDGDPDRFRPDGMVLCYPVISGGRFAHRGSFDRLMGYKGATEEELATLSLELHVSDRTPPTFLWHTSNDGSVPVENSLMFAAALREKRVPFELHVFPDGKHGLSLATAETAAGDPDKIKDDAAAWVDLAVRFMRNV